MLTLHEELENGAFTGFHHVASRIRTLATGLSFQCAGHTARHQFSLVTMPVKVDMANYLTLNTHSAVSALQMQNSMEM